MKRGCRGREGETAVGKEDGIWGEFSDRLILFRFVNILI